MCLSRSALLAIYLAGTLISQAVSQVTQGFESDQGPATSEVELIAEMFVPDSSPPTFAWDLRGLPRYRFKVSGSPTDIEYDLLVKRLGQEPEALVAKAKYVVDSQERLLMVGQNQEKERVSLVLGDGFARGEPIEFRLTSADNKVRTNVTVVPFPLESDDSDYRISMILTSRRGYVITAQGFEPNQEVKVYATAGSFTDLMGHTFDAKEGIGMSVPDAEGDETQYAIVAWNAPRFRLGGSSELRFQAKGGEVTLKFDWGTKISSPRTMAIDHLGTAATAYQNGAYDEALRDIAKAIDVDPTYVRAYVFRGTICLDYKHDYDCAVDSFSTAIRLDPSLAFAYWGRGILRAIYPDKDFRDGRKAVSDLTRACELTDWKNAMYLADLGAAYAEAGDFDQAIHWQKKALGMASDDVDVQEAGRVRLDLYRQRKPFHLPQ